MEVRHRQILQTHWVTIIQDLEPNEVLDTLIARGVVDGNQRESIQNGNTRYERGRELLTVLQRRGPHAFSGFLEALKDNYPWLYDILHQADAASQAPAASASQAPASAGTECTNCFMPPVCKNGKTVNDVPRIGMRFMTGNADEDENILVVESVIKTRARTRGGKWIYDVRVRWNADAGGAAVQWTYPTDMLENNCRYFCNVD